MISIIIPALNEERYIEKTLKIIPKNIEKIVVCNGCTDKTGEISRKYAKVYSIKQKNVSLARNYGASKSSGNIIIFLDADTFINDDLITKIKNLKEKDFFGTCKVRPDNKKFLALFYCFMKNLIGRSGIHNSSGIIFSSKELFEKVKFNEEIIKHENQDFSKRARRYGKRYFLNSYVITSMRRFDKIGYLNVPLYWIREMFHKTKDYPIVR